MATPIAVCVRYMPAVFGMEDLSPGTTIDDAKRKLAPYIDKGLKCCIILTNGAALYLEHGGERTGPAPEGGIQLRLRPLK